MKRLLILPFMILIISVSSETLFQVKDASNQTVLDVSSDGLRVMNQGDTMMVISPSGVNVNINSAKGLSRTFSVTTPSSIKGRGLINALEIGKGYATMSGDSGMYTDFSPENIFLGLNSGSNTVPNGSYGMNNVFLGNNSGVLNHDGTNNIFIGYNTGYSNMGAMDNIFIGNYAGYNTESDEAPPYGSENIFIGTRSGFGNVDGFDNVYIGNKTGESNDGGGANVFIGGSTGQASITSNNTLIGGAAFYQNTTGNTNTALGAYTGTFNLTGSGNVFLGYSAGYNETGSNKLYIENSNSSTPLVYGEFDNNKVKINGNFTSEEITTTNDTPGVYGKHAVTDNWGIGVKGEGKYKGVYGETNNASGTGIGVNGYAYGTGTGNRYGLWGSSTGGVLNYGVYASATGTSTTNYGIYASASGTSTNWAGYFSGNVYVSGTVTANAYTEFKMDHPIDPENKYLSLSSVASNEMTSIINGNVKLDLDGKATVLLPDWFEASNTDFKYQLTAVGAPGPNLFISKEIRGNRFEISGGTSGMKVSWMITAVRNDNYAKNNPINNVTDKNIEEKGFYLNPQSYGKSEDKGIEYQIQKRTETKLK